jgi:23S rRNA pseudouridine1911/1915/1917 synthase
MVNFSIDKLPFSVIYEDNHLIIVNKQSGVLVQGDQTGDVPLSEMVKMYLKEKYNKQGNVFCGVIHRIDRPVSGLVMLAKTSKSLERMNLQFKNREIHKTYWAISKNRPAESKGHLTHWLRKDHEKNKVAAFVKQVPDSQLAELDYRFLQERSGYNLIEVNPITGRPHQIRVQMKQIGCVIVGDVKYGFPTMNSDGSIHLHARSVQFMHPVQKTTLSVEAELPKESIWNLFD